MLICLCYTDVYMSFVFVGAHPYCIFYCIWLCGQSQSLPMFYRNNSTIENEFVIQSLCCCLVFVVLLLYIRCVVVLLCYVYRCVAMLLRCRLFSCLLSWMKSNRSLTCQPTTLKEGHKHKLVAPFHFLYLNCRKDHVTTANTILKIM